ncbi:hypothetical protein AQS8620_01899 [Aquimixticola soesokkakensis]|uniref:DUF2793 domain-containing protein n=1 Tax=Aquimixticola soesokkakensis TaxID=1519096 RepID=A0A1Y5SVM3_9RHOB|nr:DUF2793 domain-containing protein [Aquimixticola soesokkakensis]SLN46093.1 hypothetical protein AQS8620_01899 [Aquimixticola soesokkakensis]
MTDTPRFDLPLLQAAQAQKHVTVNEALARIDAVIQCTVQGAFGNTPPVTASEGACFVVGAAPVNDWASHAGEIALFVNNGWAFVVPTAGFRAYRSDTGQWMVFDGEAWQFDLVTVTPNGAGMGFHTAEIDHVVSAGASSAVTYAIPGNAVVYGVTGRVVTDITGTATGFSLGVAGSTNRYGSGLSLAAGSWLRGLTGTPLTYYGDEDLVLSAEGGTFSGGTIRLAVHYATFALPRA